MVSYHIQLGFVHYLITLNYHVVVQQRKGKDTDLDGGVKLQGVVDGVKMIVI